MCADREESEAEEASVVFCCLSLCLLYYVKCNSLSNKPISIANSNYLAQLDFSAV